MALTIQQAAVMARNPAQYALLHELVTYDELFSRLPFMAIRGESMKYKRERSLGSAGFISPNSGTVSETSATADDCIAEIRTLAADFDIPGLTRVAQDSDIDPRVWQLQAKTRACGKTIADKLINGAYVTSVTVGTVAGWNGVYVDAVLYVSESTSGSRLGPGFLKYTHAGTLLQYKAPGDPEFGTAVTCNADGNYTLSSWNTARKIRVTLDVSDADEGAVVELTFNSTSNEPDGIKGMIVPGGSQLISSSGADGDAFAFSKLDRLISNVKVGIPDRVFFMNSLLIEKYYAAVRALGGTDPQHISLPGFGTPIPTYRGIPIFRNDNVASDEAKGAATTLSSVYLAALSATEGLCACYTGQGQATADLDPFQVPVLGFMVEDLGPRQTVDAYTTRVKAYLTFMVHSSLSIARASEIITA